MGPNLLQQTDGMVNGLRASRKVKTRQQRDPEAAVQNANHPTRDSPNRSTARAQRTLFSSITQDCNPRHRTIRDALQTKTHTTPLRNQHRRPHRFPPRTVKPPQAQHHHLTPTLPVRASGPAGSSSHRSARRSRTSRVPRRDPSTAARSPSSMVANTAKDEIAAPRAVALAACCASCFSFAISAWLFCST